MVPSYSCASLTVFGPHIAQINFLRLNNDSIMKHLVFIRFNNEVISGNVCCERYFYNSMKTE